jgi:hypothetical protein
MANCMIGFPNNIDSCVLSGGSFVAGLPRDNIKNRKIRKVARTADTTKTNTQLKIDQGANQNTRILSFIGHNFSVDAKYRIRGGNDATFATWEYDSGWQDVWPIVYPFGTKQWEDPSWFGGKYSANEIKGYTATLTHILPQIVLYRYFLIEFDDEANAAGFLQWGRVFIGPAWQPQTNMSYGQSIGWETDTQVQKALGGGESFDVKIPYRVDRYSLDHLSRDEAMANVFEIQRRAGVDKEVMWIEDPDDKVHAIRTQYLARLRTLSPVEWPYWNNNSVGFEIKELQ